MCTDSRARLTWRWTILGLLAYAAVAALACPQAAQARVAGGGVEAGGRTAATPRSADAGTVVYRRVGGVALLARIYRPPSRPVRGTIVMVHGGGFQAGTPAQVRRRALAFARYGFVVVTPEYRLTCPPREGPRCGFRHPAPVEDVRAAVAWARRQVVRPTDRPLALLGFSAGGYLSQMAAVTASGDERPDAVASWSGPSNLQRLRWPRLRDAARRYIGCLPGACPADWENARPAAHVTVCTPPMLLAASRGEPIRLEHSRPLANALRRQRVPVVLHQARGSGHARELASQLDVPTARFLARRRAATPSSCSG